MKTANIKYATIEILKDFLRITEFQAWLVLRIARRGLDDLKEGELEVVFPDTDKWIRSCYTYPSQYEIEQSMMNEAIGGFGIEVIALDGVEWYSLPHFVYCNTGDTYSTTLIWDYRELKWFIGCWGDVYEYMESHREDYE